MLLTMCCILVAAGFVVSYMLLTQGQFESIQRSQRWNNSMILAEAGVEEALSMLNKNIDTFGTLTSWPATAVSNGWAQQSYNVYTITRTIGTNLGYYTVKVDTLDGSPTITSSGYAKGTTRNPTPPKRTVVVKTKLDALIAGNLVSITNTTFNGNGVTIDSFDSADPNHSNWVTNQTYQGRAYGTYPFANPMQSVLLLDPQNPYKRKDNAIVATDAGLITVQNANICGYVDTAPGGTSSLQSGGSVGTVDWVFVQGTSGIQPGHARDDMNTIFPDVVLPQVNWQNLSVKVHGPAASRTTNYWITAPGYYCITNDINGKNNNKTAPVTVTIDCNTSNAVLYVPTGIKFSSGDGLFVRSNADLVVYSGDSVQLAGQGSINNETMNAQAFALYGLPTCTAIDFGGNMDYTGFIYAPEAYLTMGGSGTTTYDAVGAFIAYSIVFNGHMNFHYDEALMRTGASRGYIPISWQEVKPTN